MGAIKALLDEAATEPEEPTRAKDISTIVWGGITIQISYEADWLGCNAKYGHRNSHLELRSINPPNAPNPMTETGYRSVFLEAGTVEEFGGPLAYVKLLLDGAAKSMAWKRREVQGEQLSLF